MDLNYLWKKNFIFINSHLWPPMDPICLTFVLVKLKPKLDHIQKETFWEFCFKENTLHYHRNTFQNIINKYLNFKWSKYLCYVKRNNSYTLSSKGFMESWWKKWGCVNFCCMVHSSISYKKAWKLECCFRIDSNPICTTCSPFFRCDSYYVYR